MADIILHPAMWHDYDIDIVNRDSEFSKSQLITSYNNNNINKQGRKRSMLP